MFASHWGFPLKKRREEEEEEEEESGSHCAPLLEEREREKREREREERERDEMSEEGRKLVKKATKLLQPSVFAMRMKPDWDQATPLFEEAARIFSRCRAFKDAQYSFERASEGQQRLGSELHAVRHLESAAECATKDKRHEDAFHLYEQGFTTFAGIGKVAMGAKVLANGAKSLMEEGKSELAEKLYDVALEAVEDDGGVDSSSAGTLVLTSQDLFNSLTKSKCFSSLKVFFFCFFFLNSPFHSMFPFSFLCFLQFWWKASDMRRLQPTSFVMPPL